MKGAAASRNAGNPAQAAASPDGYRTATPSDAPAWAGTDGRQAAPRAAGLAGPPADGHARVAPGRLAERGAADRQTGQRGLLPAWLAVLRWVRRLGLAGARARGWCVAAASRVRARWRSSLQLRVSTVTLVISAVVVSVLGIFLVRQIADDLLTAKVKSATSQVDSGLAFAESSPLGLGGKPQSGTPETVLKIVQDLQPQGNITSDFSVAIRIISAYQGTPVDTPGANTNQLLSHIPRALERAVEGDRTKHQGQISYQSYSIPSPTGGQVQGLLFGAPFSNYYQLYYFFPLAQEQGTLSLVRDTLLLAALALVVLLAGLAWLVTRWVVAPVARAAQGAKRLSTGKLDERLQVRGEDELAALATSFNEMAASLQDKLGELQGLSQVQRQFVSDVSHELLTPLATIRCAADVLFDSRDQMLPDTARAAELMHSQVERFELLLTDLLEISRFDANAATLDAEPVDVCDLVRNAADVAQQLAERRGASIEFRLPAQPCVAELDRRRVERILRNLLVNAVEYGECRGAVVTVAGDRDAVAVSVRDHGVGLQPGEEQLVFERFWRADPARARTTGGTGLGLAIALEDARLHGGWLEAWGAPGQGSVFRLTLPRVADAALAGSPLPLGPDEAEVVGALPDRPGDTDGAHGTATLLARPPGSIAGRADA